MNSSIAIPKDFPNVSQTKGNFDEYLDLVNKEIFPTSGEAGEACLQNKEKEMRFTKRPDKDDCNFNKDGKSSGLKYKRDTTGFTVTRGRALPLPQTENNVLGMKLRSRQLSTTIPTQYNLLIAAAKLPDATFETVVAALSAASAAQIIGPTPTSAQTATANAAALEEVTLTTKLATFDVDQITDEYLNLPLTDAANILFEKHLAEWYQALKEAIKSDNELLKFLHVTHSAESKLSIEASPLFVKYPADCFTKSLQFWRISKSIHQTGNGAVKLHRTQVAMTQTKQGDMSHEQYMDHCNKGHRNMEADFGEIIDLPGHKLDGVPVIRLDYLSSLIYLCGIDKEYFRHQLEKITDLYPDGKIGNFPELLRTMQAYKVNKGLTNPSASQEKGNRVLAATTGTQGGVAAAYVKPTRPNGIDGCNICFDLNFTKKALEHSNAECPCNPKGNNFNQAIYTSSLATFEKYKKTKSKKGAEAKPTAHAATVAIPVATATTATSAGPGKNPVLVAFQAAVDACKIGSDEYKMSCSLLADYYAAQSAENNA